MTINVGELVATMRLDNAAFTGQLRDERGRFISQSQQMGQQGGQALAQGAQQGAQERKGFFARIGGEIGDEFTNGIKKALAGAAIIAAGKTLIGFFKESIDAASDMNETVSKSGAIFGSSAGAIREWSKTAATSLGLSQQAALDSATSLGDMFLQLKFTGDEASKMSTSTVQLAADLGSFSNLETGDVLDRITGALRGEYDSLQAVIPNINGARVEHEALAASGKTAASELTAAEKATAVLAIVTKDGERALGDFSRTADGAANTSKTLAAQWSDLQVEIGTRLMPVWQAFQDLMGIGIGIMGDLVGIVGGLVDWFSQLPGPVQAGAAAFAAWVLVGPQVIGFMKGLAFVIPTILAGMGGAAGAARALGAGLLSAFGGPIGLAILGVTAAIGFLISQTGQAEVTISDFGAAIDETTGKLKANSTEALSAAAAQSGHLQAYKAIGGAVGDYVNALQGLAPEQDKVHTQLLDAATAALKQSDAWERMVAKGTAIPEQAREIASGILAQGDAGQYTSEQMDAVLAASAGYASDADVLATAAETAAAKLEAQGSAAGKAGEASTEAADPIEDMKDATKELGSAADAASVASDFLWQSLLNMPGVTISAEQATRALRAAFDDMERSARNVTQANLDVQNAQAKTAEAQATYDNLAAHLGQTLDGQAASATNLVVSQEQVDQASRDLAAAQLDEANAHADVTSAQDAQFKAMVNAAQQSIQNAAASYSLKAAQGDLQGATNDLYASTEQARNKFIETAIQMGYNRTDAENLATQYGLVPGEIVTEVSTPGMGEAQNAVDQLAAKIAALPLKTTIQLQIGSSIDIAQSAIAGVFGATPKAEGGMAGPVSGPGTGTSDTAGLFVLSNEEWVTRARDRRRGGNQNVLDFIHRGGTIGGLAGGGRVGDLMVEGSASPQLTSGPFGILQDEIGNRARAVWEKIKESMAPVISGYNASAGVEQWRGLALQALAATGEDASNITALLYQMQTESGGNPNAINLWDINAQRGYPSQGLLQVIPPTFVSALSGTQFANLIPRGPTDPWANIIASILYARRRYGSLANAYRGVAYDAGGVFPDGTAGVNTSGEDEYVLTGPEARAAGLIGSAPSKVKATAPMIGFGVAGEPGGGRSIQFTGPIQVGHFASAAELVNHAFYAGL